MTAINPATMFAPLGADDIARAESTPPAADLAERIAKARALVSESAPIADTPAAAYLSGRGIDPARLPRGVVGWHAGSSAILFVARDGGGEVSAVQRVTLTPAGTARTDESGRKIKRSNGAVTRAAMIVPGQGVEVLVCEGPEDALSLSQATGQPVRCAFGVAALGEVPLPDRAPVVLVADNDLPDAPARIATDKAVARLIERGHLVKVCRPPEDIKDGNDLLRERGPQAVAEMVAGAAPAGDSPAPWPPLVSLDQPDLPRIGADVLPGWAGRFAAALAEATETPPELAVAMILATASAAAARRLRLMVRPGYFEPLNLWMCCALPPGNRKSAVQSAAAAPLLAWERDQAEAMAGEIKAAASERKTQEARIAAISAKAARTQDVIEFRDLADDAARIEAEMVETPRPPQLWTSDATPERLGPLLADNGEVMAWLSSEGGVFDLLSGRYSGGIPNLDLVLKSHSGDAERVDRGSRPPVYLRSPLLTVGLSPQPDVLRGLTSRPGFRGRGLLGRFLYMLPLSPLGYRTLTARPVPEAVEADYARGIRALLDLELAPGPDGEDRHHLIRLSPDAHAEWLEFARTIEAGMRPGGEFEGATDWAGKCPGAAARLAGVLHAIQHGDRTPLAGDVTAETMGRALDLMAVIARHSLAALDLMGNDESIAAARKVWDWVKSGQRGTFSTREAWQGLKGSFARMADLNAAFEVLEERGYLEVREAKKAGPGRPASPTVIIRPDLSAGW
jgi:hypothetical protein